jgi:pyrimidine-nucleoside phosphorylase
MIASGDRLELGKFGPTGDKHSTGGVGDAITLVVAPLAASLGVRVAKMSGRGLGHTGGTLDKLEAIPGLRTRLAAEEFASQVRRIGVAIGGQSSDLAPADGALYALRDVTATVESIPLIVSSILSKKLASGTAAIVFDVKCGGGAFLSRREEAKALARELVAVSSALGLRASALLTRMDEPLGEAIGNANETAEAFAVLREEGPADVTELTRSLGVAMLVRGGIARDAGDATARLDAALRSGDAVRKAEAMVEAQGGNPRVVTDPTLLPSAATETPVPARRSGVLGAWDARALGEVLVSLGGGRRRKEDAIDPRVGIRLTRKAGERVAGGETIALVAGPSPGDGGMLRAVAEAATITEEAPPGGPPSIVLEEVSS